MGREMGREFEVFSNEIMIQNVMTRMPYTVAPDVLVPEAKQMMTDREIRHLPVVEAGELVGLVSDRDLRTAESFRGPGTLSVRDVMASPAFTVSPKDTLAKAVELMLENKIGSVVVTSPNGIAIGIFTAQDALGLLYSLVLLGGQVPRSDSRKRGYRRAA